MSADPILEEVWRIKDEIAKEFNYDLDALVKYLQEKQREHPERVVLAPRPLQQTTAAREDSDDYGKP
jgi:hypothetical protein